MANWPADGGCPEPVPEVYTLSLNATIRIQREIRLLKPAMEWFSASLGGLD